METIEVILAIIGIIGGTFVVIMLMMALFFLCLWSKEEMAYRRRLRDSFDRKDK